MFCAYADAFPIILAYTSCIITLMAKNPPDVAVWGVVTLPVVESSPLPVPPVGTSELM